MTTITIAILSTIIGATIFWLINRLTAKSLQQQLMNAKTANAVLQTQLDNANNIHQQLLQNNQEAKNTIEEITIKWNTANQELVKTRALLDNAETTINGLNAKSKESEQEVTRLVNQVTDLKEGNATLTARHEETLKRIKEQQEFVEKANEQLKDAFNALSAEALKNNNESFVTLAKSTLETQVTEAKSEFEKKQQAIDAIVKPLSESLSKFDTKIQDIEKVRLEQHGQINQYIQGVQLSTEKLQKETQSLVSALKTSHGRGRYGEIALKRVVEVAGMTEHCDFEEQVSVSTDEGILRPDMTIHLPERKTIVVDSKVPLAAYMRAFETENEDERKVIFIQHAAAVREHLKKLSAKAYWSQFSDSPDYVVLYMQIESSFGIAMQADPTLIEDAIRNNIIFATPTTLITLLRTVGFVWQQVKIAENIEQIRDAGIELYNRTTTLVNHFAQIGSGLKSAVTSYNKAVSSLESRFVPQAKKLHALGSSYTKSVLPDLKQIEIEARHIEHTDEDNAE